MDIKTKEERSRNMSHIHSRDTKPEVIFRKWMFSDGFRYVLGNKTITGHPDMWMPKYNTAVFIHGCFWHRHAGCKYAYTPKSRVAFWEKKFENNIKRDEQVAAELKAQNVRILIVWECTIRQMIKSEDFRRLKMNEAEGFLKSGNSHLEL